jgi:hypothetical protein
MCCISAIHPRPRLSVTEYQNHGFERRRFDFIVAESYAYKVFVGAEHTFSLLTVAVVLCDAGKLPINVDCLHRRRYCHQEVAPQLEWRQRSEQPN